MSIERANKTVDTYYIQLQTENDTEALSGLEAGGISTVGQAAARDVPWRVAEWEYHIRGLILPGGVEIALESL